MAITEADPSIRALELAGYASWPAKQVIEDGDWLIRLAPQLPYKRTNSINCLNIDDDLQTLERLEKALVIFAENDVQPTLRTTPLTPTALKNATCGPTWSQPHSETLVMTAIVDQTWEHPASKQSGIEYLQQPTTDWIADYMTLTKGSAIDPDTIAETLSKIEPPVRFLRLQRDGACLGVAVSVVHENLVGLFGLAVSKTARRQGLGRLLSTAALGLGVGHDAHTAWLQVEADNPAALALYTSLGFRERYRYAYRTLKN